MGRALAANQCEGGWNEGGRVLANSDMLPFGDQRMDVMRGDLDPRALAPDSFYPARKGIDFYHRYKQDSDCLPRWVLKACAYQLPGAAFFPKETKPSPMKKALPFTRMFLGRVARMTLSLLVTLNPR